MKKIAREQSIYTFSKEHRPAATIVSGESILFETSDCFNNMLTRQEQLSGNELGDFVNPATGPLYIENAEEGDILKIEIVDIKISDMGVMTVDTRDPILGDKYEESKLKTIEIVDDRAVFNEKIELPIKTMIGVIGVAPHEEEISTVDPGNHGGNMDCKEIVEGSILYLPVNAKGGLLAMGDLHAVMGDGETGGCGLEIKGEVTVKVDVIKNKNLPLPIVINKDKFITIASAETLDDSANKAVINMHQFLVDELKMDIHEASFLLSLAGDLKICQIVNPLKTTRMELPMYILEKYEYIMP